MKGLNYIIIYFLCFIASSCATYYQRQAKFNINFQKGDLKNADKILADLKHPDHKKDHLIYYLNRGTLNSMMGNYVESNDFFEEAYRISDDYHKNYVEQGLSFLTNPQMMEYKGEDFELFMINYYKALNYLKLGQKEEALVECKRMDIRLNMLNDKYKSEKKYTKDAFVHTLMGIIYDANQDYNNAFIAYRNALEIYQTDYKKLFGLEVPQQLKKDILRTAYLSGFQSDVDFYEKELNTKYIHSEEKTGDVIFLWHNGLGPIKAEWSINFNIIRGQGGIVSFVNQPLGLSIPFQMNDPDYHSSGLANVEFIRVAFPKYLERKTVFEAGNISWNNQVVNMDEVEDINAIAFKSLQDRMLIELGTALLRVGLKKAAEYRLRKESNGAGAVLGLLDAVTEKADTRNWQTLPHSIYYSRISLPEGKQNLKFTTTAQNSTLNKSYDYTFDIKPGQTFFQTISSLDYIPPLGY